jgi:hypothetical protein
MPISMLHAHDYAVCLNTDKWKWIFWSELKQIEANILKQIKANWSKYFVFKIRFLFEVNILKQIKTNWSEYEYSQIK